MEDRFVEFQEEVRKLNSVDLLTYQLIVNEELEKRFEEMKDENNK